MVGEGEAGRVEEVAYIVSVATDQGTGGSSCSRCGYDLSEYCEQRRLRLLDWIGRAVELLSECDDADEEPVSEEWEALKREAVAEERCPGCDRLLRDGGVWAPIGGRSYC